MITLLQLTALSDTNEVLLISTDESGQKRFLEIDRISPLLEPLSPKLFRHKKLLYGGAESQPFINISPDLIYNSVSDPDRCSHALQTVRQAAKKNPFPFINHPEFISNVRDDRLYALTKDIDGLISPTCIRIKPRSLGEVKTILKENNLIAPLLFKEAGTDPESKNQYLLKSNDALHELERFAFDGRAYYVKAFYNYSSKDTLYRKYRFFVIGNKVLPGHLIVSSQWHIVNDKEAHSGIKDMTKILDEEKDFLKSYLKKRIPALVTLKERLQLDFFAIDCSITAKGEILLFGVDCAAHYFENVKNGNYYTPKQIQRYNEAVETMIINKLKAEGNKTNV